MYRGLRVFMAESRIIARIPAVISADTLVLSAKCSGAIMFESGPNVGKKGCKMHFSTSLVRRLSRRRPLNFPSSGFGINFARASRNHRGKHLSHAHLAAKRASALKKLSGALLIWVAEMLSNPPRCLPPQMFNLCDEDLVVGFGKVVEG